MTNSADKAWLDHYRASKLSQQPESVENTSSDATDAGWLNQYRQSKQEASNPPELDKEIKSLSQNESFSESSERNVRRQVVRAAEAIIGMPGEIAQGVAIPLGNYVSQGMKMLTGIELKPEILAGASTVFPTSEDVRNIHEPFTGEKFKPQGEGERKADEITQDVIRIGVPTAISGMGSGAALTLARIGGGVGGGQIAKSIAKGLGYGEEGQENAKLFGQLVASVIDTGLGRRIYEHNYDIERSLPNNVTGHSGLLRRQLETTMNWVNSDIMTPAKQRVGEQVQRIINVIDGSPNNRLSYRSAANIRHNLNSNTEDLYTLPRNARNEIRGRFGEVHQHLENFIDQARASHPEWVQAHRTANEVFGALEGSRQFSRYIRRNAARLGAAGISSDVLSLLSGGFDGLVTATGAQLATGGTVALGEQAYRLGYKIWRSPTLRNAYMRAVAAGVEGNFVETANALRKIDKAKDKS